MYTIKVHSNLFSRSGVVICEQMHRGMVKVMGTFLRLLSAKVPKNGLFIDLKTVIGE
jgi:hypothetical protein